MLISTEAKLTKLKNSGQVDIVISINQLNHEQFCLKLAIESGEDVEMEIVLCHLSIEKLIRNIEIDIRSLDTSKNLDYVFDLLYSLEDKYLYNMLTELCKENSVIADIMPDIYSLFKCEEADQTAEAKKFEDSARTKVIANLDTLVKIAGKGNNFTELTQISGSLNIQEISDAMREHQIGNKHAWAKVIIEDVLATKQPTNITESNELAHDDEKLCGLKLRIRPSDKQPPDSINVQIQKLKARIHGITEDFNKEIGSKKTKTSLDIAVEQTIND